jgi:hypothetical protein
VLGYEGTTGLKIDVVGAGAGERGGGGPLAGDLAGKVKEIVELDAVRKGLFDAVALGVIAVASGGGGAQPDGAVYLNEAVLGVDKWSHIIFHADWGTATNSRAFA